MYDLSSAFKRQKFTIFGAHAVFSVLPFPLSFRLVRYDLRVHISRYLSSIRAKGVRLRNVSFLYDGGPDRHTNDSPALAVAGQAEPPVERTLA